MAQLFRNTLVHQIFGANTDVGKTVFTTALLRASLQSQTQRKERVFYLKPIAAGPDADHDDRFINKFTKEYGDRVKSECLYRFRNPTSPHLAARSAQMSSNADLFFPNDRAFAAAVTKCIQNFATHSESDNAKSHIFVETAGGVHTPSLTGTSQAEAYRPLLLPTILIAESKLGGISTTISAFEALHMRGYTVDAVLCFENETYQNNEYLEEYFGKKNIKLLSCPPPPAKESSSLTEDENKMEEYYTNITASHPSLSALMDHFETLHASRIEELQSMPRRTRASVWWPFVQHDFVKKDEDITVIDSAHGDWFSVYKTPPGSPVPHFTSSPSPSLLKPHFDASASWWTQALGHASSDLTLAAAHASGRYGHVMFPQASHLPALQLTEKLLSTVGKNWASRVFFSDDGSTGMEVALKMALRAFTKRHHEAFARNKDAVKKLGVLGLKGSYHGDTIGNMDATEDAGVYTCEWHEAKGYWLDPPTVGVRVGKPTISLPDCFEEKKEWEFDSTTEIYRVEERLESELAGQYRAFIRKTLDNLGLSNPNSSAVPKIGALVLEPIIMGAGGMIVVDPLFQRILVEEVRSLPPPAGISSQENTWSGLPVIFDEVFVGLYRASLLSPVSLLGVSPDIAVYAKILTGGLVPMAVTLSSKSIFEAFNFEGAEKKDALLHGHSYTAHPIGCAVALKTLEVIEGLEKGEAWQRAREIWDVQNGSDLWSFWSKEFVLGVSMVPGVEEVMALGTVLAVKFKASDAGYSSTSAQTVLSSISPVQDSGQTGTSPAPGSLDFGVHFRTLGSVAYFMGSLNTPADAYRAIEGRIMEAVKKSTS